MNELIRESDPIEPVQQDGMLYMDIHDDEEDNPFLGFVIGMLLSIGVLAIVLAVLYLGRWR